MNTLGIVLASWFACAIAYTVLPPLGVLLHLWAAAVSVYAWRKARRPATAAPTSTPRRTAPRCSYCTSELFGARCNTCGAPA